MRSAHELRPYMPPGNLLYSLRLRSQIFWQFSGQSGPSPSEFAAHLRLLYRKRAYMKLEQQPSKSLDMSIGEINEQRDRFQLAPGTTSSSEELPLLEKQALVDEILRGMPIRHIDCYEKSEPDGKVYMVTKGWPQ